MLQQEFAHPVEEFAMLPIVYTGTSKKFETIAAGWKKLLVSRRWRSQIADAQKHPRQMAIPVEEPNHLISQTALVTRKAENQAKVLLAELERTWDHDNSDQERSEKIIIPEEVWEMYAAGYLALTFLSTDVGVSHRVGTSKWHPLRNVYIPPGMRKKTKEKQLIAELSATLASVYKLGSGEYVRAIDSGLGLTQVLWRYRGREGLVTRIFPAVSTVGVKVDTHVLGTENGRRKMLEWMRVKHANDAKVRERKLSPLAILHGRAGGIGTEDLVAYAREEGVGCEILATGQDEREKLADLQKHFDGASYHLLRTLMLTLLTIKPEEYLIGSDTLHLFPSGAKKLLAI